MDRHWFKSHGEHGLRARIPVRYGFIKDHQAVFSVRTMCRMLMVHFSGVHAWLKEPLSLRAREDLRQTDLIRQAWTDCGKVYGYPLADRCLHANTVRRKLHDDLRDQGETCSQNRVARLAGLAGIAAQIGYKRRPGRYGGKPAVTAENTLDRQFEVEAPDSVWGEPVSAIGPRTMASDITYIKTHEGWLYLAVVIDLYSRRVVGPLSRFEDKPLPGSGPRAAIHQPQVAIAPHASTIWKPA